MKPLNKQVNMWKIGCVFFTFLPRSIISPTFPCECTINFASFVYTGTIGIRNTAEGDPTCLLKAKRGGPMVYLLKVENSAVSYCSKCYILVAIRVWVDAMLFLQCVLRLSEFASFERFNKEKHLFTGLLPSPINESFIEEFTTWLRLCTQDCSVTESSNSQQDVFTLL